MPIYARIGMHLLFYGPVQVHYLYLCMHAPPIDMSQLADSVPTMETRSKGTEGPINTAYATFIPILIIRLTWVVL